MRLGDLKEKLKPGFRFVQKLEPHGDHGNWGPYNWEVVTVVERGVTAQMYYSKWEKACRGHIHLVEWHASAKEVGT